MKTESQIKAVHTTPEKFENAALILRLDLTSTLIRHKNVTFENALETGGIFLKHKTKLTGVCYPRFKISPGQGGRKTIHSFAE